MENKEIEKIFKLKISKLMIGATSMIIAISLFAHVWWKDYHEVKPEAVNYHELTSNHSDEEGNYVKVTAKYISPFAVDSHNLTYYYVQDEEGYVFIARLSDKTMEKVTQAYEQQQENFSYYLEGYIFNISEDIKDFAISEISNHFENATAVNEQNYEKFFGKTYLNEFVTPNTELNGYIIGGGIFLLIMGMIFIIQYIFSIIRIHKYTRGIDIEEIKSELGKSTTKCFPKEKIYLTDKYIVSVVNGLLCLTEYSNLVWIYTFKVQQYGITVNIFLVARTKDKKALHIANSMKKDKLIEIMGFIKQKNANVLIGFNSQNKKEYKEYIKNQK